MIEHPTVGKPFDPGRRKDPEDGRDHLYRAAVQPRAIARPATFRRRYLGPNLNQGQTPHCVTYASTSVMNRMERLDHGSFLFGLTEVQYPPGMNPAAEWLYRYIKSNGIDAWPNEDGTDSRSALKVLHDVGLTTGGASYKIGQYARIETVEDIMEAVYLHGPVLIGLDVDSTWWQPLQEGTPYCRLASPNGDMQGGHEVEVVGYRDATTSPVELQGLWIKNSWGSGWGYAGFCRLPFSHLERYNDWDAWWLEDSVP